MEFDPGTNVLYGDNAQERRTCWSPVTSARPQSRRGSKDKEIIRFSRTNPILR